MYHSICQLLLCLSFDTLVLHLITIHIFRVNVFKLSAGSFLLFFLPKSSVLHFFGDANNTKSPSLRVSLSTCHAHSFSWPSGCLTGGQKEGTNLIGSSMAK